MTTVATHPTPLATPPPAVPEVDSDSSNANFIPVVNTVGTKKLELQVHLLEETVVIRDGQSSGAVVRGHVTVLCREEQKSHAIKVVLVGTKTLSSDQQMGGTGANKSTLVKLEKILETSSAVSVATNAPAGDKCAIGTYKLPFEFAISRDLPPTMHVPRSDIDYSVVATLNKSEGGYLRLFPKRVVRAQQAFTLVKYSGTNDPSAFVQRLRPIIKVGTLGGIKTGKGAMPYRVILDRNVAAPGDLLTFKLEVYPPGQLPELTRQQVDALAAMAGEDSNRQSDDEYASDNDADEDDTDESPSPQQTPPNADDAQSVAPSIPWSMPPGYSQLADTLVAGKSTDVTSYKVRAKLVQRVCYLTDHDLVADTADDVYLFWTKRVISKEKVSDHLDLTDVLAGKPLTIEWTMPLAASLQCDTLTSDIQVRHDIYLDFSPREGTRNIRGMVARVHNDCISSRLPLRIIPVPISTLLANPPSYNS